MLGPALPCHGMLALIVCCNSCPGLPGVQLLSCVPVLILRRLTRLLLFLCLHRRATCFNLSAYVNMRLCVHAAGVVAGTAVEPVSAVAALPYTLGPWHAGINVCCSSLCDTIRAHSTSTVARYCGLLLQFLCCTIAEAVLPLGVVACS
jgi:hypothetical protein